MLLSTSLCLTQPCSLSTSCQWSGLRADQLFAPVLTGKLPTGEVIEMHETTLMPGQMPHAAHRHVHCEFMLFREGTVEFTAGGKSQQLGPGGVAYAASGEMHGLKNVGTVPANYFVIAIGTEPDGA